MDTTELKRIVECMVFASDCPVRLERLSEAIGVDKKQVRKAVGELLREYEKSDRGFVLQEVGGGIQFRTRPEYAEWVRCLNQTRPFRFSRAALETLAIIAYKQPITRSEVEYLRGVDSGGVVKTLLDKHLIRILGKKDVPGRPMIYGTSREFLELFGLRDLTELPTLKEFSELSVESLEEGVPVLSSEASPQTTTAAPGK